ncbi:MAG: SDR family oxidoreductase [Candidatus Kryptonium sp.]|nr:SDR family oxidoreductase [Candidatus Kryptonium sp.]MCX7761726.1 SDR family oxidoreductase [Candidatus Kryptonium sp.]MDW8109388.1 SDR family oxidoreductase [Candidatus Kryptonium sp.]
MNILVTGGAGFIGSHVVDAYIQLGHNVIVVDNLSTGSIENLNPKAKFYQIDIRDDKVEEVFKDEKIDIVNHHAAQMDVRKSVEDPIYDADVNIIGSLKLLQFSIKYGVQKFIFASTGGAVYGEQDYFPADEDHPTRPLSPYGVAKLTVEKYLYFYKEVHGLNYVILRYANIYGPRQNPHGEAGVVAIFTSKMLKGEQPIINGDGLQTRDYTYVGDVVRANVLALDYEKSDVFNIGTGLETDVNTLFYKLKSLTGATCDEIHGPAKPGEQRRSVISYQKIYKAMGWKPEISLDEGLKLTVEFFKNKFQTKQSD